MVEKIGLIGCGYWGYNYVRVINETPRCQMIWCCDSDVKKLQRPIFKTQKMKISTNYRKMLKDNSLDAIIVSTPTKTHYQIARDCLEAGKHVLVEKPLAESSGHARELIELARKQKRILMVGHTFEFNPGINKIKEYVEKKIIGNVFYVHLTRTGLGPIRNDVNALWDLAPHDISILLYVLGKKPTSVLAIGASYLQKGLEDVVFMTLRFNNNLLANIHVSWLDPYKVRKMTLVGDKKMVVFDDTSNEMIKFFNRGAGPMEAETFADFKAHIWDGNIIIPKIKSVEPLKEEFSYFMKCIKKGSIERSSAEDGYNVVKILEAVQESIRKGETVPIDWDV